MPEPRATAPRIPAAYGVPTDGSGSSVLPWSRAVEQLEAARNYWICTTRRDGRPHSMPVWGVWLDDAVAFSTGSTSEKARNLARDPRVVAHLESGDDTVIIDGVAVEILETETLDRIADAYEAKYGLRPPGDSPVFVIRPSSAYTWRESDFQRSATRWIFD
jgi:hypothetical protein